MDPRGRDTEAALEKKEEVPATDLSQVAMLNSRHISTNFGS